MEADEGSTTELKEVLAMGIFDDNSTRIILSIIALMGLITVVKSKGEFTIDVEFILQPFTMKINVKKKDN